MELIEHPIPTNGEFKVAYRAIGKVVVEFLITDNNLEICDTHTFPSANLAREHGEKNFRGLLRA